MILPIRTDSPLRSTPWVNWALIAINVIVFFVQQTHPGFENPYVLDPRNPRLFDFFTYAFLHANTWHLVGNMLFLYIFGNNVNDRMGNIGYLGFYLAGAVFAGIGYLLFSDAPMLGASGAVSAVTGAYLALLPRSNITIIYFFWLIGMFEIPSIYFIIFYFLQDVFLNFAEQSNVAHMAHISGSIFGFLICLILLWVHLLPRNQFDVVALLQRWTRRRQYRDMVNAGYDPFNYSTATLKNGEKEVFDARTMKIQSLRAEISESIAHHNLAQAATLFLELKTLDPKQVLSRQAQLDIANQLASQQMYPHAAEAYEQYLSFYATTPQIEQVQLMLGLIYARYLHNPERAKQCLSSALPRLHGPREIDLAQAELSRLSSPVT